jgi:hypothetical protein
MVKPSKASRHRTTQSDVAPSRATWSIRRFLKRYLIDDWSNWISVGEYVLDPQGMRYRIVGIHRDNPAGAVLAFKRAKLPSPRTLYERPRRPAKP